MTRLARSQSLVRPQPDQPDPFRYGWREVRRSTRNGKTVCERVPLTLEDVLHPQVDDVMPKNSVHDRDIVYLFGVLDHQVADDPQAIVLCDVLIDWDIPGLRSHSPDLSVIFGVRDPTREWTRFNVAAEGVRPRLLIEIVSPLYPEIREQDLGTKVHHYHLARVPFYVVVDRERMEGPVQLIGYRYRRQGYQKMRLKQGRLWLEPVQLWLGTRANRVVCYDKHGKELGDYTTVSRELADSEARAKAAEARAESAETRLQQLEAELRRLRGQSNGR